MAEKLGEMLIHVGALTAEQLEEVLSAQSIYGGRLGTNLVQMGLLREEDLARLLNKKLGVPHVDPSVLDHIPASLISLIPREMAQRFKAVPVALDGRRLTLAMADPADFAAIEEVGFYTGFVVVPRVCSELRLTMALERYYGIKAALHFIPVQGGVRTRILDKTRKSAGLEPPRGGEELSAALGKALPGTADGVSAKESAKESAAASRTLGLDELSARLAAAAGEGDVVNTLMCYLQEDFDRAGFLRLRQDSAIGVQAFSEGQGVEPFAGWALDIADSSLLKKVLRERAPFLGKLPPDSKEGEILDKLGGAPGSPVVLMPVVVGGVSIAFLMVEDEKGRLAPGLFDLQRVVVKTELAFEMLGIKKRIRLV